MTNVDQERLTAIVMSVLAEITANSAQDYSDECSALGNNQGVRLMLESALNTANSRTDDPLAVHVIGALQSGFQLGFTAGRRYGFTEWAETDNKPTGLERIEDEVEEVNRRG